MKRRSFVAAAGAVAAAPFSSVAALAPGKDDRQYLELIVYHTHVGERRDRVAAFYRDVALGAYERLGIGPVGVFTVLYGANQPSLYVLIPHTSLESAASAPARLRKDPAYLQEGAAFLDAPLSDPAYVRQERQLMLAFADMPEIEFPRGLGASRIFELRIYESHSIKAGQKKIEMFNEGGEIGVFRKTGLNPVFFGETIFGPLMPNLTYMLAFDSMETRDKNWRQFVDHPEWHALRDDPQYQNTVSNISDIMLRPTSFSQI